MDTTNKNGSFAGRVAFATRAGRAGVGSLSPR
jgi:hypothetical protein